MNKFIIIIFIIFLTGCALIQSNPRYVSKTPKFYIVKKGDTLNKIAKEYSIAVDTIKKYNNLDSDLIIVGQKLYFTPPKNTFNYYVTKKEIPKSGFHIVKKGETLPIIAVKYNIPLQELMDYNNLSDIKVRIGQKIALKKIENISVLNNDGKTIGKSNLKSEKKKNKKNNKAKKQNKKREKQQRINTKDYILPLKGTVTSEFGMRHGRIHKGIDIAAPMGTPIKSVAEGKVVFAGIQNGYGNVIIISHKNDIMTVYAHNERNLVRVNDTVKKGQPIATVGKTGRATGPHLHFEFRVKGRAINPKKIFNF